jgi:anti-anti-sigma regulatory factor
MDKVEYLDSSALGMMLLLKEKSGAMGKMIQIRGVRGVAQQVLEVANFHKIFDIVP